MKRFESIQFNGDAARKELQKFKEDLLWRMESIFNTRECDSVFGTFAPTLNATLIVGRSAFLSKEQKERFRWRSNKVFVASCSVHCLTYDDLYDHLECRLLFAPFAGKLSDQSPLKTP
ncbi:MAG: DUF4263 domain-containing protein [Candidatus Sumerlaeota bacterium]|nr:DUF4263 domain-containing protein [Candidatus Sumerlaeota bacterium]